ncbi:MAG: 1-acyl-sn-glycerol-3-phosphate acyltransferase [Bacteroidales bacterium]|nr:1-acyl-sn-glycerol-3-phosphate acyltransferase [Bacteroidales bacterium]
MQKIKITDFYDEFRPYNETEAKAAVLRITEDERFYSVIKYFFPDFSKPDYLNLMNSIRSIEDFQIKIMYYVINTIIENTSKGLTYSGIENIDREKNYVFISNHRDIFLDASIFQCILTNENFPTTEISFGNNLMKDKLVYEVGKINKMFKVYRKGSPRELLKKTIQLSEYIRYTIFNKKHSVWIAQRGGRTKDGNDKTQSSIIKMLNSSGSGSLAENIEEINIIPLAISYEFEPNDHFKVKELLNTFNGKYEKTKDEDINSIIDGISKQKGKIHLQIGKTINSKLRKLDTITARNQQIVKIAEFIDQSIYSNYKLWPNNYIAYDLLNKTDIYKSFYTKQEKEKFLDYKNKQLKSIRENSEKGDNLFLKIYSNPVKNSENN